MIGRSAAVSVEPEGARAVRAILQPPRRRDRHRAIHEAAQAEVREQTHESLATD